MATDEDKQRRKEEKRARKQERKEQRAKEKAERKEQRAKEKELAKEASRIRYNNLNRFNKVVTELWGKVKLSSESKMHRDQYRRTIENMDHEVTDVYLSTVRNDLKEYALEDIQRHKEQVERRKQEKEEKREKRREERKETREKRNYERQLDEEGKVVNLRKKTYCEKHPSACNAGKSLKEGTTKAGRSISESVANWFKESDSKPKSSPTYDDYDDYDDYDEPKRAPKTTKTTKTTKKQSESKSKSKSTSQSKSKPKAKPRTKSTSSKPRSTESSGSRLPAVFEDDEPRSRKSKSDSGLPAAFAESPRKSTTKTTTKKKSTATKKTTASKKSTSKAKSTKSKSQTKTKTKKKSPPKKKDDWWGSGDAGLFD